MRPAPNVPPLSVAAATVAPEETNIAPPLLRTAPLVTP